MKYLDVGELVKNLQDRAGKYDEYDWHGAVELEAATTLRAQAAALEELATLREKVKVAEEALKKAERLAWETGCETVDGVNALLEDERGDLWREITAALAKLEEGK